MDWFVKHWDELTRDELYDLLAVRTAVFVVEQRCPYQEVDGLDRRAWHVFARDGGGTIQACLRVLEPENGTAQIGRVLTVDRGTTILMVTHDAFTASCCRRVVFLRDGRVFRELFRGALDRRAFFAQIIRVITQLGGEMEDVL